MNTANMKKLKGEDGIKQGAELILLFTELGERSKDIEVTKDTTVAEYFSKVTLQCPDTLRRIFAIMQGEDVETYECSAVESMRHLVDLSNDPLFLSFFRFQVKQGDAISSSPASVNTQV